MQCCRDTLDIIANSLLYATDGNNVQGYIR